MKYYKQVGYFACALLILSCFLPWAYYPDLNKNFNGFFSENNNYGKPGVFFTFLAVAGIILVYLDKIWAKRVMLIVTAFTLGYLIKTFILFTSCYNAYCPQKKAGIYLLALSCILIAIVSVFPDIPIMGKSKSRATPQPEE